MKMELNFEQIMRREAAQKKQIYHDLNQSALPGQIVMAGSSLMEQFPMNELLMSSGRHVIVYNRGLGGFTTEQYLEALDVCVLELKPRKVFINIGTNDIGATEGWQETLIANYREILRRIRAALLDCKIIVMAYYPVANTDSPFCPPNAAEPRTLDKVLLANRLVRELADELSRRGWVFEGGICKGPGTYVALCVSGDPQSAHAVFGGLTGQIEYDAMVSVMKEAESALALGIRHWQTDSGINHGLYQRNIAM